MSAKPGNYEELTRLISGLLDGQLSEPERARLDGLLREDEQARRLYMQMVDQEIELSCLLVPAGQGRGEKILPLVQPEFCDVRARWRQPRWLAAAAVLVVMASVFAVMISRNAGTKSAGTRPQDGTPLAANTAETWSEDFEAGLPAGWVGTLVSTNLPAGSKHGMGTGIQRWAEGISYAVQSPANWESGLLTLTEQSTLHVTYRFARGAHVNVFLHTMPPGPAEPGMFQLRPAEFPRSDRRWQTASIPFSRFMRKVPSPDGRLEFIGGPPQHGERVAVLAFSWVEPIDFVIDRIWVTPTGSGETETQILPNQP